MNNELITTIEHIMLKKPIMLNSKSFMRFLYKLYTYIDLLYPVQIIRLPVSVVTVSKFNSLSSFRIWKEHCRNQQIHPFCGLFSIYGNIQYSVGIYLIQLPFIA